LSHAGDLRPLPSLRMLIGDIHHSQFNVAGVVATPGFAKGSHDVETPR